MKDHPFYFYGKRIANTSLCNGRVLTHVSGTGYQAPYEIEQVKSEHDFSTCAECQKSFAHLKEWLNYFYVGKNKRKPFPLCCAYHEKLINYPHFKRDDFANTPEWTAKKILYTARHISESYQSDDWYKLITHYIEYAVESFGMMPKDCGNEFHFPEYLERISVSVKKAKGIPDIKKQRILAYIDSYYISTDKKKENTDLSILISTYNKWLNEFPFEIHNYFGELKEHYQNTLPILKEKFEQNIYSLKFRAALHTQESLVAALVRITEKLLGQINSTELIEKGVITDYNKHQIDLINKSHRIKQAELIKGFTHAEKKYLSILKEWLQNEKEYFKEIVPLLTAKAQNSAQQKPDNTEPILNELSKAENQFWKGLPMQVVVDHFRVMTERKNKKGVHFLTPEQLCIFLKRAFLNDTAQPKQKINYANGEKGFVIKRFYELFDLAVSEYAYPQKKKEFIQLIINCFDNWDERTFTVYFKPNKTKESW